MGRSCFLALPALSCRMTYGPKCRSQNPGSGQHQYAAERPSASHIKPVKIVPPSERHDHYHIDDPIQNGRQQSEVDGAESKNGLRFQQAKRQHGQQWCDQMHEQVCTLYHAPITVQQPKKAEYCEEGHRNRNGAHKFQNEKRG